MFSVFKQTTFFRKNKSSCYPHWTPSSGFVPARLYFIAVYLTWSTACLMLLAFTTLLSTCENWANDR